MEVALFCPVGRAVPIVDSFVFWTVDFSGCCVDCEVVCLLLVTGNCVVWLIVVLLNCCSFVWDGDVFSETLLYVDDRSVVDWSVKWSVVDQTVEVLVANCDVKRLTVDWDARCSVVDWPLGLTVVDWSVRCSVVDWSVVWSVVDRVVALLGFGVSVVCLEVLSVVKGASGGAWKLPVNRNVIVQRLPF